MQGKKKYTPKIFYQLSLDALVPEDNFYRKLQSELALDFLCKATRNYYGNEGQAASIRWFSSRYCLLAVSTISTATGLCFATAATVWMCACFWAVTSIMTFPGIPINVGK